MSALSNLSLRNKAIGSAVIVFIALLVFLVPGDREELTSRQERVVSAQSAFDLANENIAPVLESVIAFIDEVDVDLSGNRTYTGLASSVSTFNRANASITTKYLAVIKFRDNIHKLLDGSSTVDPVEELNSDEYRTVVAQMDGTLNIAWLALMEMNVSIDEYNEYGRWVSAWVTSTVFGLPGYEDPIPTSSRLNRNTSLELEQ